MSGLVDVCALDELEEGVPAVKRAGNRELVLARWRGEVFALRNVCPHQSQSFMCGNVHPRLRGSSAPGGLIADAADPVLACPWHTWEFRLQDGRCTTDPQLRVATYPVGVENGRVLVDLRPKRARVAA
ncbi:nitrite reductase (NAD(P)H) small subunit [Conexibacter sp. CPCC 206217]|uniref:Rieske (2Fe-2S) protein n=1 Tax=Conexibacter sp. CPCC 206217 TaxID=3064574 RepID=UPI002719BE29|nr:nitrite reductase (NAD(P)H) small subunit [Conexibacter sp. CPCC 206217]MDO8208890.1 nitrite reductase (NAD(P)H) small subunit [Conexibacter sp. CPCC 206217]